MDKEDKEITQERVEDETDLDILKAWLKIELKDPDWFDNYIIDLIKEKVELLETNAKKLVEKTEKETEVNRIKKGLEEKIKEGLEKKINKELKKFDYNVYKKIENILPKYLHASFFKECEEQDLEAIDVEQDLSTSRQALISFCKGKKLKEARWLVDNYKSLMELNRNTINVVTITSLVEQGFLAVRRETYCDTTIRAGSVYVFWITLTNNKRLTPEWHVHWGLRNRIEAASFKDKRMAVGEGARVETDTQQNQALKQCITNLGIWGP